MTVGEIDEIFLTGTIDDREAETTIIRDKIHKESNMKEITSKDLQKYNNQEVIRILILIINTRKKSI